MPPAQRQSFQLDYIDVAERIVEFRAKHPTGSFQQHALDFREINGGWWCIYTAAAYRTPDDERPGMGTAWEPIPGRTNFTRDSEVQNAETAAWGRAIVAALAADTKRGVASAEEVRRSKEAQAEREIPTAAEPSDVHPLAAVKKAVWGQAQRLGWSVDEMGAHFAEKHEGLLPASATADQLTTYLAALRKIEAP